MNILVLTSIHPMQILDIAQGLHGRYDDTEVFSIQEMALMFEEQNELPYPAANILLSQAFRTTKGPKKWFKDKTNNIIYGNLDKRSNMKFDMILAVAPAYGNTDVFDDYLRKAREVFKDFDEQVRWYSPEEAIYTFPSVHHLQVFLETLGLKEREDAV